MSSDGFNTFSICKLVNSNKIKSCLSGVGADEFFGGYSNYKMDKSFQFLSKVRKLLRYGSFKNGKYQRLDGRYSNFKAQLYILNRGIFSDCEVSRILTMLNVNADEYHARKNKIFDNLEIDKKKNSILQLDQLVYLRGQLLRDADAYGMQNSVEIRVPFLDQRVTRYCESNNVICSGKLNKEYLIHEYQDILPKKIYTRKKMGFSLPFINWMCSRDFEYSNDIIEKLNAGFTWQKLWVLLLLDEWINTQLIKNL